MANRYMANCRRLERILLAAGFTTRTGVMVAFDAHGRGTMGLIGIGRVLSKQLAVILREAGEIEWAAAFPGIAWA